MTRYIISSTNGTYWTGTCWGVREAAEVYATLDEAQWVVLPGLEADSEDVRVCWYEGDDLEPVASTEVA